MSLGKLVQVHQFLWSLESHYHQRLAWQDSVEARIARVRAEEQAAAQLRAMLEANPSGQLGRAKLDDPWALIRSGLVR